jgi:ethanolamine ammonia-lyase large subunit
MTVHPAALADQQASERVETVSRVYLDVMNEPLPDVFAIPSAREIDALADWMIAHDEAQEHLDAQHAGPDAEMCADCAPLIDAEQLAYERLERIEHEATAALGRTGNG